MTKKHKQKQKKKIAEVTNGLSRQCQISSQSTSSQPTSSQPTTSQPTSSQPTSSQLSSSQPTSSQPSLPRPAVFTPIGETVLADQIKIQQLAKWPKLKLKVPPIFIHQPVDFEQHVKKLLQLGMNFFKPHLTRNFVKVLCQTFNDHKYMIQYLDKKQLPYHTFGHPTKRKMKVVIRGLPIETDLNIIKKDLKSFSIPIIRVHKMHNKQIRTDNTILVLAVVPYDDEGKGILKVTKIMGYDVKLEPPKDKLKQCHRCQKWGHSQRYCHGQIRCVKCAGEHLSKKCEKTPEVAPKCANCNEAHTASYRRCKFAKSSRDYHELLIAKELQPCYSPQELVTVDNYQTLYRNVKKILKKDNSEKSI